MQKWPLKSPVSVVLAVLTAGFLFCSCSKTEPVAADRPLLGVTPWPADFTLDEQIKAYSFIQADCDMVSHHFDDGIPYEEAFSNGNMPSTLQNDIDFRKSRSAGKKVLLSVSALDLSRKSKANYYRDAPEISQQVKAKWTELPFEHPDNVKAYTNYIIRLVGELQPAWINYAVESNLADMPPADFVRYKTFLSEVYAGLKKKFPHIPVMLSLIVTDQPGGFRNAKEIMPYSDYIALSAYPYTHISSSASGNTNPDLFPASYFENWLNLDPKKPWCFAETSYIAENLELSDYSLKKTGTPEWQNRYLQLLINLLKNRQGKFLIWFCYKDYDAGVERLKQTGQYQSLISFWQDTGLFDENHQPRPALQTWRLFRK